ncbi:MAG: hypothetical protein JW788_06360 [Candidatus Omnitrophica bacterium]|nr:hypothetical protein [Candidatus Omnitrophota bacterium]
MQKRSTVTLILLSISLWVCPVIYAASIPANMGVPKADGVKITITKVFVEGNRWAEQVSVIAFGPLSRELVSGDQGQYRSLIQQEPYYFAIDIGLTHKGGANINQINIGYQEGNKPAGQKHGLGWKTTATFIKMTVDKDKNETQVLLPQQKKLLKDLKAEAAVIPLSDIQGGWLRIYLGLVSKDPKANPPDPAEAEVFSSIDMAGDYSGNIMITSS